MGYYQDTPTRSHKSHKCQTPPVSSASSHWGDFWDFWQCPETKTETERNLGNLGGHMLSENQQEKSTGQHMSTSMLPLSIDFLWFLATLPKTLNPRLYSTFEFFTNSSIRNLWNNGNVKHREASAALLLQLHPVRSTDQSDSSATLFSIYSIWIWTELVFKP